MSENKTPQEKHYARLVDELTPNSRHLRGCVRAFWVGGLICTIGQLLTMLAQTLVMGDLPAPMFTWYSSLAPSGAAVSLPSFTV